jgi:ribosome biogenesis GTPase / thiamine phosphate phosphatase
VLHHDASDPWTRRLELSAKAAEPAPEPRPRGVVARVDFGGCLVLLDDGTLLEATVRGRVMGPRKALGNTVVVGDVVEFAREPGSEPRRVTIETVAPRRNAFSRRASGRVMVEQVVAANLDQVVVVASVADPELKPGLVDRVLAQAEHAGLPGRLVLNKIDLGERSRVDEVLDDYARAGTPGHATCARTGAGLEALRHALHGRRSLFVGHSGVGKSTLLNGLEPGFELLSGRVNPRTGKGRHTTSAAWLLRPEPDLELIDTPGVRAFALWGIGPRDLEQAYAEFRPFLGACRFTDCGHGVEPGCAIRRAVEEGHVARRRYDSYLKLRAELEHEEQVERMRGSHWS